MGAYKYGFVALGAVLMSSTAFAQMELYPTTVSIGAPNGYNSSSTTIDLDIVALVDDMSSGSAMPFPTDINLPYDSTSLSVNGQTIDTAAHCTYTNYRQLQCQYPFPLTSAQASSPSLTFNGKFSFAASVPSGMGDHFSDGTRLNSIPVTVTSNGGGNPIVCPPESNPMMPTTTNNGSFVFTLPAQNLCSDVFWIDPPVSVGYTFSVGGAKFSKIKAPSFASVPDSDGYSVSFTGSTNPDTTLLPGQDHTMGMPVTSFVLSGIEPDISVDPNDQMAFPMGIELSDVTGTSVVVTQTPVTALYPANSAPTAVAGSDQTVTGGSKATLDGTGSTDPDGDVLTYAWQQTSGPFASLMTPASATTDFYTPYVSADIDMSFDLIVTDTSGSSSVANSVNVKTVPSSKMSQCTPWTVRGLERSLSISQGISAYNVKNFITGQDSSNLQAYVGTLAGNNPNFDRMEIKSYVKNAGTGTTPALHGSSIAGLSPMSRYFAHPISPAPQLYFTGDHFQSNNWYRLDTKINMLSSNGNYIGLGLPDDCVYQTLYFKVAPTGALETGYTANVITNSPPLANAGPAQTVLGNSQVQLDGTASSDPDGDSLTYYWTQISGPNVALTNVNSATPTFWAPAVTAMTKLVFELKVKDSAGNWGLKGDEFAITVNPSTDAGQCSPWNRDHVIASLSAVPSGSNYSVRHHIAGQIATDLQAEAGVLNTAFSNFDRLEIKSYVSEAGTSALPQQGGASVSSIPPKSRYFADPVSPVPTMYWTNGGFDAQKWYRLDTKINLLDSGGQFIDSSPRYPDSCLYETVYFKINSLGGLMAKRLGDRFGSIDSRIKSKSLMTFSDGQKLLSVPSNTASYPKETSQECSTVDNPLLGTSTTDQFGRKTYKPTDRNWCENGEWVNIKTSKHVDISAVGDKLVEIMIPDNNKINTNDFFTASYTSGCSSNRPKNRLGFSRPCDPVRTCKVFKAGERLSLKGTMGSVRIGSVSTLSNGKSDKFKNVSPQNCIASTEPGLNNTVRSSDFSIQVKLSDPSSQDTKILVK